jgi:hypothetical protein
MCPPTVAIIASPGGIPERSKGTGCKPVGSAFEGSNPSPTMIRKPCHGGAFGVSGTWLRMQDAARVPRAIGLAVRLGHARLRGDPERGRAQGRGAASPGMGGRSRGRDLVSRGAGPDRAARADAHGVRRGADHRGARRASGGPRRRTSGPPPAAQSSHARHPRQALGRSPRSLPSRNTTCVNARQGTQDPTNIAPTCHTYVPRPLLSPSGNGTGNSSAPKIARTIEAVSPRRHRPATMPHRRVSFTATQTVDRLICRHDSRFPYCSGDP